MYSGKAARGIEHPRAYVDEGLANHPMNLQVITDD